MGSTEDEADIRLAAGTAAELHVVWHRDQQGVDVARRIDEGNHMTLLDAELLRQGSAAVSRGH
jgi:hypothetical protein